MTTKTPSLKPSFQSFIQQLQRDVANRKVSALDEEVLCPLFGGSSQSLFTAAHAAVRGHGRAAFIKCLEWMMAMQKHVPPRHQPLLAAAASAMRLVVPKDGDLQEAKDAVREEVLLRDLDAAISELDRHWGHQEAVGTPRFSTSFLDLHPELKARFQQPGLSLATWYVWDVLWGLHQDQDAAATIPFRTASAPVLLVNPTMLHGVVALLTIELLQDGGSSFTPIPESLGLTALSESFHQALQHAWKLSGVEGWRGRWKLTQFPMSPDKLNEPLLKGRSLEAAVCATVWSALGEIPGTDERTPDPPHTARNSASNPMDLKTALTARLGDLPASGKRTDIPLIGIDGLSSKMKAARDADLELVLIADVQEPKADEAWASIGPSPLGPPKRCQTIGQAWSQLHQSTRFLRLFQTAVAANWKSRWCDEVEVADPAPT